LRQSFGLEILGTITALHFYGKLNADNTMGASTKIYDFWFHKKKGADFMARAMPKHCAGDQKDPYLEWTHSDMDWHLVKTNSAIDNMPVDEKDSKHKTKCKTEDFANKRQKN